MKHPIEAVTWCSPSELVPNGYNPNVVFDTELRLLRLSLVRHGWIQPILATDPGREIIDGFHRWWLASNDAELRELSPRIPVTFLPVTRPEQLLLTVRMNRAKGSHIAAKMRDLVRELVDVHALDVEQLAGEIGADPLEVETLYGGSILKDRSLATHKFSKAWRPVEKK